MQDIIRHAGSSKPRATIVTKARRTAAERVPAADMSVPHLRTLSHIQVREPIETEHNNVRAQIPSTWQLIYYIFFLSFCCCCRFHVWRYRRTADTYSPKSLCILCSLKTRLSPDATVRKRAEPSLNIEQHMAHEAKRNASSFRAS